MLAFSASCTSILGRSAASLSPALLPAAAAIVRLSTLAGKPRPGLQGSHPEADAVQHYLEPAVGCRKMNALARSHPARKRPEAEAPTMEALHAIFERVANRTRQYDFVKEIDIIRSPAAAHIENIDLSPVPNVEGRAHSIESLSALDGPGLRWVLFTQGCKYRCHFCSNPDSWDLAAGTTMTSKQVAKEIARAIPYVRSGGGGVTVSGGEPLLQPDFVSAIFQECRHMGIPTAVDTTGMGNRTVWSKVLPHTDLAMLCVKAPNPDTYARLTGGFSQEMMLRFSSACEQMGIPMWIRYVLIPGMTDSNYDIEWLSQFCEDHKHSVEKIDVLPYHTLGVHKWEVMGLEYPLAEQRSPTREETLGFLGALRGRLSHLGVTVIGTGVE